MNPEFKAMLMAMHALESPDWTYETVCIHCGRKETFHVRRKPDQAEYRIVCRDCGTIDDPDPGAGTGYHI